MLPRAFVTHLALMALLSLAPLPGFTETGADADAQAAPPSTAAERTAGATRSRSNIANNRESPTAGGEPVEPLPPPAAEEPEQVLKTKTKTKSNQSND
ncbi:MAG TPA: hypothetical protein VK018_03570 [Porticoccaceae bacterium]|nr:hypothetical protein [Porticoccaceae bacterium]